MREECNNCLQPMAGMERMTASGTVAVGRQQAAPPVTYKRTILLGSRRHAVVDAVVKGARPEFKVRMHARSVRESGPGPGPRPWSRSAEVGLIVRVLP